MKPRANLQLVRKPPLEPISDVMVERLGPIVKASGLDYKFGCELTAAILAQNLEVGKLYAMIGNLCSSMSMRGYPANDIAAGVIYAAEKLGREGKR